MKCEVSIDWLTFTIRDMWWNDVIKDVLGMNPDLFQDTNKSLNGYQNVKAFGNIYVCFQPRENQYFQNMGVCVSMSGTGCRTFENFSKYADTADKSGESKAFNTLFVKLNENSCVNITRLDIACDDKEGYLDMKTIVQCVNNKKAPMSRPRTEKSA